MPNCQRKSGHRRSIYGLRAHTAPVVPFGLPKWVLLLISMSDGVIGCSGCKGVPLNDDAGSDSV